ncbi:MAG: hypothetical protein ACREA9_21095 [Pyrinomonadaceae bacterium]
MSEYLEGMNAAEFNEWIKTTNRLYALARLELNQNLPMWLVKEMNDLVHPSGKSVPMLAMLIVIVFEEPAHLEILDDKLVHQLQIWMAEHNRRIAVAELGEAQVKQREVDMVAALAKLDKQDIEVLDLQWALARTTLTKRPGS